MLKLGGFILFILTTCLVAVSRAGVRDCRKHSTGSVNAAATADSSSSSESGGSSSRNSSASAVAGATSRTNSSSCTNTRCPPHEHYVKCQTFCPPLTCEALGKAYACPIRPDDPCIPGCQCDEGYYRNASGTCVTEAECLAEKCPPNEHYVKCKTLCPPRTCEALDRAYACPIRPDDPCIRGCQCDEGYYRNALGTCVTEAECRECPGPFEGWDSCPDCSPQTCASRYASYYCPAVCIPSCRCKKGYYRNSNGTCIPECECEVCPDNEVYSECPSANCGPLTCAEAGFEKAHCGSTDPCLSEPGCVCKGGYLRNDKGICIPAASCPSCGGDDKAIPGCGNPCGKSCSDIGRNETIFCPEFCRQNGCDCKKGYVFDGNTKKCVKPKDCTPKCKKNERWVKCPEALCIPLECSQVGYHIACPLLPPGGRCPKPARCICIEGYVRDCNGKCIPQKQCPSCGGDKNAVSGCGHHCDRHCGDKVDDSGQPQPCPCKLNGCSCKKGYIYDPKKNLCVRPSQCTKVPTNQTTPGTCSIEETLQLLQQGNAIFTGKFLYESYKSTPTKNLIMSPVSLFVPVAQCALRANGPTYDQLIKVLNLRSKDDIKCVFPAFISKLRAEQEIALNLAAILFFTDDYPLNQSFLEETKNIFDAGAESLNFRDNKAAADRINAWVANETNDRIKDIATPDMFNEDTRLVLANAIYFLGNWVNQFNPNNTEDRQFNTSSTNSVKIPTMYQEGHFNYAEVTDLDCKIVKLFYKGGNFSFVVLLPNSVDGLPTLTKKVQDPTVFYKALNSTTLQIVQIHLPKIKTVCEYNLIDIMTKAGIIDIFDITKSNLTDILQTYEPLYISAAKQKAFCEVDETGTEAAAANVIVIGTVSAQYPPPPVYIFDANRPFIFYIFYNRMPIFCGTFVNAN